MPSILKICNLQYNLACVDITGCRHLLALKVLPQQLRTHGMDVIAVGFLFYGFNIMATCCAKSKLTYDLCAIGGKRLTSLEGRVACLYGRGAPPWITAHTRCC